ncbi:MAG: hypothetical protein KA472_11225 [Pseudomonadales bacterium]|nr:hypothetical protein [Pseudomonadales bacterium]
MAVTPSADIIDQDACGAIREILTVNKVPVAAFIDDHVGNAIWQRNVLADCLRALRATASNEIAEAIDKAMRQARIET